MSLKGDHPGMNSSLYTYLALSFWISDPGLLFSINKMEIIKLAAESFVD